MAAVRQKGTASELLISEELASRKCSHVKNQSGLPGSPDIVIEAGRLAVFVHGCYWHGHSCRAGRPSKSNVEYWSNKIRDNRSRDRRKARQLRQSGWHVATIWSCRIRSAHGVAREVNRLLRIAGKNKCDSAVARSRLLKCCPLSSSASISR